ncbi:hypothetical protein D5687_09465 [Guyparkeria sp. SCN-R1]|nr:hypothetical protein D5687_09465 [Guyparkeria sp. SCN-R1]
MAELTISKRPDRFLTVRRQLRSTNGLGAAGEIAKGDGANTPGISRQRDVERTRRSWLVTIDPILTGHAIVDESNGRSGGKAVVPHASDYVVELGFR